MRTAVAFLGAALALAGCGLTSSPADNLTFAAPAGWQASPGILGYMQFWKSPATSDEVLMLFKSPKPLDPHDVFSTARVNDAKILSRQSIHICGNQPAEYLLAAGTSNADNAAGNGKSLDAKSPSDAQVVMTDVNGTTYISMYVYPVNRQPNPQAAAALRELCAK